MSDVLHASRHRRTAKAMDPNRGIHFMFACSFFYLLFTCANPIRRRALISVSALFGARPPLHPVVLSLAAAASLHHKGRRRRVRECPKAEDQTSWPSIAPKTVYELHTCYVRIPSSETNLYSIFWTWYSMHNICDQSYSRRGNSELTQFLGPSKRIWKILIAFFDKSISSLSFSKSQILFKKEYTLI